MPTSRRTTASDAQLDALIAQATIDCYNDTEQATGLFTLLDEHLALPFTTTVLGVDVTVTRVDIGAGDQIFAACRRDGHRQRIAIIDLPLPAPAPEGAEWIDAYSRWLGR